MHADTDITAVRCTDCESTVELVRDDSRTLCLTCDCDEYRSLKVARALPSGWSA